MSSGQGQCQRAQQAPTSPPPLPVQGSDFYNKKFQGHFFYSQRQLQHFNQGRPRHLLVQLQNHEPVGEPIEPAGDDEADQGGDEGGGASLDQY